MIRIPHLFGAALAFCAVSVTSMAGEPKESEKIKEAQVMDDMTLLAGESERPVRLKILADHSIVIGMAQLHAEVSRARILLRSHDTFEVIGFILDSEDGRAGAVLRCKRLRRVEAYQECEQADLLRGQKVSIAYVPK